MANKFTQGKAGEALAYPKTLAEAVFLEENGENIKKDILALPVEREVLAAALCFLKNEISNLGKFKYGIEKFAQTKEEVYGGKKSATGIRYSIYQDRILETVEEIVSTALNALDMMKAISSAIAPEFVGYKNYNVGDCCTHNGRFYERLTAGVGYWKDSEWELTDLASYIKKHYVTSE